MAFLASPKLQRPLKIPKSCCPLQNEVRFTRLCGLQNKYITIKPESLSNAMESFAQSFWIIIEKYNCSVTWSRTHWYKWNDSASFVISDKCSWHNVSTWQHHLTWLLIKYLDIQVLFCNSWRTVQFIIYLENIAHNMLLILLLLRMWRMWLNCMIKMISIHKIWDMSIQMFCKTK